MLMWIGMARWSAYATPPTQRVSTQNRQAVQTKCRSYLDMGQLGGGVLHAREVTCLHVAVRICTRGEEERGRGRYIMVYKVYQQGRLPLLSATYILVRRERKAVAWGQHIVRMSRYSCMGGGDHVSRKKEADRQEKHDVNKCACMHAIPGTCQN